MLLDYRGRCTKTWHDMTQLILNHHASVRRVKRGRTPSLWLRQGILMGSDLRLGLWWTAKWKRCVSMKITPKGSFVHQRDLCEIVKFEEDCVRRPSKSYRKIHVQGMCFYFRRWRCWDFGVHCSESESSDPYSRVWQISWHWGHVWSVKCVLGEVADIFAEACYANCALPV